MDTTEPGPLGQEGSGHRVLSETDGPASVDITHLWSPEAWGSLLHPVLQRGKPRQEPWWALWAGLNSAISPQLNSSAVLGPAVGLLKLPRSGARPPRAGTLCRVAGWGSVSDFEDQPPGLMEAEVRVLGLDACNRSWTGRLKPAMLCTHSEDSQRRGFCSVRSSLFAPPAYRVGKLRPTERGRTGQSLWNQVPACF